MFCTDDNGTYSAPMPWIGFYATAASAACFMAMFLDLVRGICPRSLWFSCKYFALNATSLTLLAIATKLPTDISTPMPGPQDQLAKLSGTALICIAMGHFMPSIGAMEDSQVILNVVPLVLLVITAIVDVCIQMRTGVIFRLLPHHIITLAFMLIMLLITCSAALSVRTMRQSLKQQYELKRRQVSCEGSESSSDEAVMATFTRLKNDARKCWMMALSRDPVYVLRRSCLGAASDILCILQACVVLEAVVEFVVNGFFYPRFQPMGAAPIPLDYCIVSSDYKVSIAFLDLIQLLAIETGAFTPCLRTSPIDGFLIPRSKFNDDLIKQSDGGVQVEKSWIRILVEWKHRLIIGFKEFTTAKISWIKRFVRAFKIERHWIQSFVEWKEREIRSDLAYRGRVFNQAKDLTLEIGRCLHILVVVFCKLLVHFALLLAFVSKIKAFMKQASTKVLFVIRKVYRTIFGVHQNSSMEESVDPPETKRELRNFVLHLEGEDGLVDWIFQSCYSNARVRRSMPSRDLMSLLNVSTLSQGFIGLAPSGSDAVRSAGSNSQEPPKCWALPLVTLTSVAIAIPQTKRTRIESLVDGVSAGLKYVKLVDKKLDSEGMANIREAADVIWRGILFYRRWLDVDLTTLARKQKDLKKVLEHLAENGNRFLVEFEKSMANVQADKTSNVEWAPRALAGISMHRICGIILRDYSNFGTDELFEWSRLLISDMLGACLTNLPRALYLEYVSSSFDAKEDYSVQEATCLLGETEKILEVLGKGGNQDLVINQCKYFDHWRSFMLNPSTLPPISCGNVSHDDCSISIE